MQFQLLHGDCVSVMPTLPDEGVDAIVTDPPYGLSFMGKDWDHGVPGEHFWREALRVAKPGTHLLAFGGTRMFHRLAVAIEDAGWELRDTIGWLYGSGFPKSKNLDGDWQGWGTALKPAWEPIIVARKPLIGTVAANVLAHGTGALNVDGCRVAHAEECRMMAPSQANIDNPSEKHRQAGRREAVLELKPSGRWPANLIHDGSDEVVSLFPVTKSGSILPHHKTNESENRAMSGKNYARGPQFSPGSSGSAARFFYCAKASKKDRDEDNSHPTVKPTDLMRYLCRLVTPPAGVILDPFMGSGSTGKAAILEGFRFIGIERMDEYLEIARARIEAADREPRGLF